MPYTPQPWVNGSAGGTFYINSAHLDHIEAGIVDVDTRVTILEGVPPTPDATSSVKGKVQLTGDLGGTAASPTVPGLAGKAPTVHTHAESDVTSLVSDLEGKAASSHTHAGADITSSTVATARLGSGTASSATFLRGDQTWAIPSGGGGASAAAAVLLASYIGF